MSRRTDRMSSLVQIEIGELIVKKLKDPRIGFVTITGVDMTSDLKQARVYYTVLGKEKERRETQKGLEHSAGYLQHEIAVRLKLRYTPKLMFRFDESLERGIAIESILHDLKQGESIR